MRQRYETVRLKPRTIAFINVMNTIIEEYQAANLVLTVRQLYYQLVARGVIQNDDKAYANVKNVANKARLAGLMDWDAIEDRVRAFRTNRHYSDARDCMQAAANSYYKDRWTDQPSRVFVIVEKDALFGVLNPVCREYDVPLLAARGYPSSTVLRDFARKHIMGYCEAYRQTPVILHFGDHDPSGIDMSRDLQERIALFSEELGAEIIFKRVALNMDQIEILKPPPNPAKMTDSRVGDYINKYGPESWELDAVDPIQLQNELRDEIIPYIVNEDAWNKKAKEIELGRRKIQFVQNLCF